MENEKPRIIQARVCYSVAVQIEDQGSDEENKSVIFDAAMFGLNADAGVIVECSDENLVDAQDGI